MLHAAEKSESLLALLRCYRLAGWHSLVFNCKQLLGLTNREMVNRYARKLGIKLLQYAKVNYTLHNDYNVSVENHRPCIFMSNHLSVFDVPLLYATLDYPIRMIAKKELFQLPLFGRVLKYSEHVMIDRDNPEKSVTLFSEAKKRLQSGLSLWTFPEGTRSLSGKLLPFKTGIFRLAREAAVNIIPVGIVGTQHIMPTKKLRIYQNQLAEIRVGEPIDTKAYRALEKQPLLMQKVRDAIQMLLTAPRHPAGRRDQVA